MFKQLGFASILVVGLWGIEPNVSCAQSWMDFGAAVPRINYPTGTNGSGFGGVPYGSTQGLPPTLGQIGPTYGGNFQGGTNQPLMIAQKNWRLGVRVQNTEIGAVVQEVDPNSAAQQAGVFAGDIIVAVGGSRIGEFDGRTVDIADEMRRNVDPYGRISMVVQDSRNLSLRPVRLTLNATSGSLSGSIATRDRSALPYGATLVVELRNVSRPFYEVSGGKTILRADGVGPFPFELNFDQRYIDPRDQYQLNALITYNNQVVYSLPQPIAVSPAALSQPFNVVLDRGVYQPISGGTFAGAPTNTNPNFPSDIVSGYPGVADANVIAQLFQNLLGRSPRSQEIIAWQEYLRQGNSVNAIAAKLMSTPQYRERFANDASYVQQAFTSLTNRAPTSAEVSYWLGRLQATGSMERMITEILSQSR